MRVWVLEVPVDEARDRLGHTDRLKAKGSLWAAAAALWQTHKGEFNLLRVHQKLEG